MNDELNKLKHDLGNASSEKEIKKAYSELGTYYFNNKEYDKSIDIYKKGLKLITNDEDFLIEISNNYNQKGVYAKNKSEELNSYLAGEEYYENNSVLLGNLGVYYYDEYSDNRKKEDFITAEDYFNRSIECYSKNGFSSFWLGRLYYLSLPYNQKFDFEMLKKYINLINAGDKEYPNYSIFINRVFLVKKYLSMNDKISNKILKELQEIVFKKNININDTHHLNNLISLIANVNKFLQKSKIQDYKKDYYQYTSKSTLSSAFGIVPKEKDKNAFKLRLYNASYMNDPYEGLSVKDLFKSSLKDDSKDYSQVLNDIMNNTKNDIYIASLSFINPLTDPESMPLWNSYANSHSGVSLSFKPIDNNDYDFKNDYTKYGDMDTGLYKVYYGEKDKEKDKEKYDLIQEIAKNIFYLKDIIIGKNKNDEVIRQVAIFINKIRFLCKTENYSYEKEIRVIKYSEDYDELSYDEGDPRLFVHLSQNDPVKLDLSRITFGVKFKKPYTWYPLLKIKTNNLVDIKISQINYR